MKITIIIESKTSERVLFEYSFNLMLNTSKEYEIYPENELKLAQNEFKLISASNKKIIIFLN